MLRILHWIVAALAVAQVGMGHSWVEQMRNLDDEGNYVGEFGYARGWMTLGDPGFTNDEDVTNRVPPLKEGVLIKEDTLLCGPKQQKAQQSQDKYPRLKATPGGYMALRYNENGHVTIPAPQPGKPTPEEGSGTVFIYGTTEPKEDEKIITVLQWTKDGKGGNGKGVLLAANDYADSRCYQLNDTPRSQARKKATPNWVAGQEGTNKDGNFPLQCESTVQLPESAEVGKPYTLYWVWQWPTYPGIDPGLPKGKDEYYTSCIDVDVTSKDVAHAAVNAAESKFKPGQLDSMKKAVPEWKDRTAQQPDVVKGEMGPIFSNLPKTPSSGSGDAAPAPPAAQPSPQAPPASSPAQAPPQAASSQAPAPPQAPAPSSKAPAPAPSAQPEAPKVTPVTLKPSGPTIPTLTGRPGAAPSPKPGNSKAPESGSDDVVTITDTVFLTVTAGAPTQASPSAADSKRAVTSVTAPSAKVTPPASQPTTLATVKSSQPPRSGSAAPSGILPGFNMGNPNGAKFRGMFT